MIAFFLLPLSLSANAALVVKTETKTNVSASTVTSNLVSASGLGYNTYAPVSGQFGGQNSYFEVTFDVIGGQHISLDANLDSVGENISIMSALSLVNVTTNEYLVGAVSQSTSSTLGGDWWVTDYAEGPLGVTRSLFLSEGSYRLAAGAYATDYDFGNSSYEFTLTAVPLPAAAWLFGSGLMGLVVAARRKIK